LSKELAQKEGIFVGTSAGATFAGALEVAKKAKKGDTILFMMPDTGERYLSTPLFEEVEADMNNEEKEIMNSTPYRIGGATAPKKKGKKEKKVKLDKKALEFFEKVTSDKKEPVVLFALEWCEFCWSVRKFFTAAGISYKAVDLDSVEYQKNDLGLKLRAVLADKTGLKTIPQIFVGGEHIGGATEAFDAWNDKKMQKLLEKKSAKYDKKKEIDPYSLLPSWLHPR